MNDDFSVERYTEANKDEFNDLLHSLSLSSDLGFLRRQTFWEGKYIYILFAKGFLKKNKIVGYAILYHYDELTENSQQNIWCYNIPPELVRNTKDVIISDFIIGWKYRRKKYGSWFFQYLIDKYYYSVHFILEADGDGLYFWNKVGFHKVENYKNIMINY